MNDSDKLDMVGGEDQGDNNSSSGDSQVPPTGNKKDFETTEEKNKEEKIEIEAKLIADKVDSYLSKKYIEQEEQLTKRLENLNKKILEQEAKLPKEITPAISSGYYDYDNLKQQFINSKARDDMETVNICYNALKNSPFLR